MPKFARGLFLVLHIWALAAGAFVAGMASASMVENLPRDLPSVALSRAATAAILVALTLAYTLTLVRRGFTQPAPFLFGVSFLVCGILVSTIGRIMAKEFAPAQPDELPGLYARAIIPLAFALVGSLAAWFWTHRHSRFPLLDPRDDARSRDRQSR